MAFGKADGLVRQQKAQNKGQRKGHEDPGIAPPEAEIVPGNREGLSELFHSVRSLLSPRMQNRTANSAVSSSRKIAAPQQP